MYTISENISMDISNRLYAFCHAIIGFKFKQVDFRHFKKSRSKTQSNHALLIVYKSTKCRFETTWCPTPLPNL